MTCNSSRRTADSRRFQRALLACCCALVLTAAAEAGSIPVQPTRQAPATITAPLMDGSVYVGDVELSFAAGSGEAQLAASRLLDLLRPLVGRDTLDDLQAALATRSMIGMGPLGKRGIAIRYAPREVAVAVEMPAAARATRALAVAPRESTAGVEFAEPADVSAFISARGSLQVADEKFDARHVSGFAVLEAAARIHGVVIEGEGLWQIGSGSSRFQRRGTRAVYDLPRLALRLTAGDQIVPSRGFQSSPLIAGVSLVRSYGLLQPQANIRPGGDGSVILQRRSIVDVLINNYLSRRVELEPGSYDLSDFPFAQGANDVRLVVRDETGREETLRFNRFADQAQLARGVDEFGLVGGVHAQSGPSGPSYTGQWLVSGFYRRGLSNRLTVGGNGQADASGALAGAEGVLSTPLGVVRAAIAGSIRKGEGGGAAVSLGFERLLRGGGGGGSSVSVTAEAASGGFRAIGPNAARIPYAWRLDGQVSHSFSARLSGGIGIGLARGHDDASDVHVYRANASWSTFGSARLTVDARVDRSAAADGPGRSLRLGLFMPLGRGGSASADYDSHSRTARLAWQRSGGDGVGAYNMLAEYSRDPNGSGLNFDGHYIGNRAELGASRFTNINGQGRSLTSVRVATALAFADGALAIGLPISDSFALVNRKAVLGSATIELDPSGRSYAATTGWLGTALRSNLSAYLDRTLTIQSPDAPPTAELGQGSFRLMPAYRSGYRLDIGSDYSVSVTGRLVDGDGQPLALIAGRARELDDKSGVAVDVFTNGEGRFGAYGLRAGRWQIDFPTDQVTSYLLVVPANSGTAFNAGQLVPQAALR